MGAGYTRALLEQGVRFVGQGSDMMFVRRGAAADLAEFEALSGEFTRPPRAR
jgi:hypothetical protein